MKKKRFQLGGSFYEIPENEISSFLQENPKAVEIKLYDIKGSKYNIPISEVDAFEIDMGLKKKDSRPVSQIGGKAGISAPPLGFAGLKPAKAKPIEFKEEKAEPKIDLEGDPIKAASSKITDLSKLIQDQRKAVISTTAVIKPIEVAGEVEKERKIERVESAKAKKLLDTTTKAFQEDAGLSTEFLMRAGKLNSPEQVNLLSKEQLLELADPANETQKLAVNTLIDQKNINEAISSAKDLEEAAIFYAGTKDPQIARQIDITSLTIPTSFQEVLSGTGKRRMAPAQDVFAEATRGRMLYQMLTNPVAVSEIQKNPRLNQELKDAVPVLLERYPDFGKMYLGQKISQKMEDMGTNNAILNIVTPEETDMAVEALISEGKMSQREKAFYEQNLRGEGGVTDFGRKILGRQIYDTPGLIESTLGGAVQGTMSLGKGAAELTGLRKGLLGEQEIVARDLAERDLRTNVSPKNTLNQISKFGGEFLGQSLSIGAGGKALTAIKAVKGVPLASGIVGGLQAYANYLPDARAKFPGEEIKQRGYATILASLEGLTENIFRDSKIVDGLLGRMKPEVKQIIQDFSSKKISAEAARQTLKGKIKQALLSIPEASKFYAKGVAENTAEEVASQLGQQITSGVFENKPIDSWINGQELFDTARQALLGSAFVAGLSARADMAKNRGITAKMIYGMAENPEYWGYKIQEAAAIDSDFAAEAQDKLSNLGYASRIFQEIQGTDMTEKQKIKYLIDALDAKVKTQQAQSVTDPVLKKKLETEVSAVQESQSALLDNIDDGTIEGDFSDEILPEEKEEAPQVPVVELFSEAGEKSKAEGKADALADFLLTNSKVGDTITDKNGDGYEVREVKTRKDGTRELVIVPFEIIDGQKDYNPSGTKLISDVNKKGAGDLYEFSYTDNSGNRVTEKYQYNKFGEVAPEAAPQVPATEELTFKEKKDWNEMTLEEKRQAAVENLPEITEDKTEKEIIELANKNARYLLAKLRGEEISRPIELKIEPYETLQPSGVQPAEQLVQPEKTEFRPEKTEESIRNAAKREEVKSSLQRIRNAGLLVSARDGKKAMTDQEINAQMQLTDAMAKVWKETTGKDNFYETFIEDVKEGDLKAIKEKGGALFQNTEVPQRPISRVSLSVFELPQFQQMKGKMVVPQAISDLMKSKGKQIEKDIILTVLNYDKYKGQKRISFDDFKDDVEVQVMKLEKIDTNTYASYGMDNLGGNEEYGKAQTIIFNSPIDHGQYGHFRSDFTKKGLNNKRWEIRQLPGTEQYVAIDADMPAGLPQNEIAQYVGTAGSRDAVEKWISDRSQISQDQEINKGLFGHIRGWFDKDSGIYYLAELQSDYFQKNKASDLYASQIPQEEVDEYINVNFLKPLNEKTVNKIKELTGAKAIMKEEQGIVQAIDKDGNVIAEKVIEEIPLIGFKKGEREMQLVISSLEMAKINPEFAEKRYEIKEEYNKELNRIQSEERSKYINERIEEIKKTKESDLVLKQFIASQKIHELRLFREAVKHASETGATTLRFPAPYTIAVIEGYVDDSGQGNAPYEIIDGDRDRLREGDTIDYGGTEMIVVESSPYSITVAPRDEVSIFDIYQYKENEVIDRMSELEYDLKKQVNDINNITREEAAEYSEDEFLSSDVKRALENYFEQNPEEETVAWKDIKDDVEQGVDSYYSDLSVEDLIGWASEVYTDGDTVYAIENRRSTERFQQPDEYGSDVDEGNFEDELNDDQQTVVNKYKDLGEMIKKMRPDSKEVVDGNGKTWLETKLVKEDVENPIIAFQKEGAKVKGAIDFSNDNKASIYIFQGADISTLAHEMSGHLGRRVLEQLSKVNEKFAKDYEKAKEWAGVRNEQWSLKAEEKFARGFEKYLREGKAPTASLKNVFNQLKNWLTNIYKYIKGSSIDVQLTPEIKAVFDNLLRIQDAIQEPTAGKVPVQPEATAGKEMEGGIPPTKPPKATEEGEAESEEERMTGISNEEANKMRLAMELPLFERPQPETFEELNEQANEEIRNGYNIGKLLDKLEKGIPPTSLEEVILAKYGATLADKFEKTKDEQALRDYERLTNITNKIGTLTARALNARKVLVPKEDTLADFFILEKEETGVEELTEEQKANITKEYNEIKAAKEALEKKVQALQEENARILAGEVVSEERKRAKRGKKTDQEFTEERKKIVENIREKLKEARKESKSTIVPYANELISIAPDVAKLVKNLVEQGVVKLEDVVSEIHGSLKEEIKGITEKDVRDLIAGEYNKKKPTRGNIAAKIVDLKTEIKLIDKLEKLEAGELPKDPIKKVERNRELKKLRDQIKEHPGTKLSEAKSRMKTQIIKLEKDIREGNFDKKPEKREVPLDREGKELQRNLISLKKEREIRRLKNEYEKRDKAEKVRDKVLEIANIPRSLMASTDFSAPLNQAIVATIAYPDLARKAAEQMIKATASQGAFDEWFDDLKSDPRYDLMKELKLRISDPNSPFLTAKEEAFMSGYAEQIPVVGKFVKASERAYVQYLNKLRVDLFNRFIDNFENQGKTYQNNPRLYAATAQYINNITGSGRLPKIGSVDFEQFAPMFNTLLFSPRLMAARINMLNPYYFATLPTPLKIQYGKDMGSFLGLVSTILTLFALYGKTQDDDEEKITVETDPTSTDFARIKQGNTRWDLSGGFQPYIRLFNQIGSGERKSTKTGLKQSLDGEGAFGLTRGDVLSSFFRNKLSPIPSMTVNFVQGRNSIGEKVTLKDEIFSHVIPLSMQSIIEAAKEGGPGKVISAGLPAIFGIGIQTYGERPREVKQEVKYRNREIELNKEQVNYFQDTYNSLSTKNLEKLKNTKEYKSVSREKQVEMEKYIQKAAMQKAEKMLTTKYAKEFLKFPIIKKEPKEERDIESIKRQF